MGLLDMLMGTIGETDAEKVAKEFEGVLVEGEQVERAFRVVRDLIVFTSKRLVTVNKQGVTGSKQDWTSIPYHRIVYFSKETRGTLDFDAEIRIWVQDMAEPLRWEFRKDADVNEVYRVLSQYVLK